MRYIFILMLFSINAYSQLPLYNLEYAADSNYVIGAKSDGEPMWVLKSTIANTDSIYISNDTIFLRDGSGFVKFKSGYGVDIVTAGDSLTISADTSEMVTQYDISGFFTLPTFTAGSVIFSNGTTLAQDNANLFWNNSSKRLGVGTASPSVGLHVKGSGYSDHLRVEGSGGGSGMSFTGGTNIEYIWYSDATKTFSIGGGGSAVTNKKLHIDGGTTIGANYDSETMSTNGLMVEGNVAIGTNILSNDHILSVTSTNAIKLPYGTTAQRPSPLNGSFRLNQSTARLEYYYPNNWYQVVASSSNLTEGSVLFADVNGNVDQDNSNLFFNNINNRFGVGTSSPITTFHVLGGSNAGTFQYNAFDSPFRVYNATSVGTGINFQDVSGTTALYYNQGTFNLGGGGNYVANKMLHIDNGVTIGASYDGTSVDASSLKVEGSVTVATRSGTPQYGAAFDSGGKLVTTGASPGSGTVTSIATTSPITGGTITTTGTIGITQSTTSTNGYLSSTDWNAFNNKMDAFYVAASGTAGVGVVGPLDQLTITAGTGITATRSLRNITVSATNTGTVTGTGTANYMTKWSGTSSITNSIMRDDGSTIGLGVAPDASYTFKVGYGNMKIGDNTAATYNKLYFGDGTYVYVGEDVADDRLYLKGSTLSISAAGSLGTSGQVLTSNGTTASWTTPTNTGTVTSVTGTSPIIITSTPTTTPNVTIQNATTAQTGALTSTDWNTFNNKVGGSGTSTRVAFWSGSSTLSSSASLFWDNSNLRLGVGTASPSVGLHVKGSGYSDHLRVEGSGGGSGISFTGGTNIEYIWYNDAAKTFSIGGGGSGVTNKKLHVNGGVTIGTGYGATAIDASSLIVEGSITVATRSGTPQYGAAFDSNGKLVTTGSAPMSSWLLAASGTAGTGTISDGSTATITAGSGITATRSSNNVTITNTGVLTEVDGSITNEGYLGIATAGGTKIRGFNSSGTGTGTGVGVTASNGIVVASGGDNSNGGDLTWQLTGQASALHTLSSNGLIARTGSGTVSARTITAGSGISVSNGDGVSGNPTISTLQSEYGEMYDNNTFVTLGSSYASLTNTNTSLSTGWGASSNTGIIVPVAGYYDISFTATVAGGAGAGTALIKILNNGSTITRSNILASYGASEYASISKRVIEYCSASAVISVQGAYDPAGTNCSVGYKSLVIRKL